MTYTACNLIYDDQRDSVYLAAERLTPRLLVLSQLRHSGQILRANSRAVCLLANPLVCAKRSSKTVYANRSGKTSKGAIRSQVVVQALIIWSKPSVVLRLEWLMKTERYDVASCGVMMIWEKFPVFLEGVKGEGEGRISARILSKSSVASCMICASVIGTSRTASSSKGLTPSMCMPSDSSELASTSFGAWMSLLDGWATVESWLSALPTVRIVTLGGI